MAGGRPLLNLKPRVATGVASVIAVAALAAYAYWSFAPYGVADFNASTGPHAFVAQRFAPDVRPRGLADTPPMGWNGFNHFYLKVSAATIEAEARALAASGMQAAGYDFVNVDGGWDLRARSKDGELVPDPTKFPHGIRPVADYVHSLGLKFGMYTSAGMMNCANTSAGSFGHYVQDAAAFASWGVDYLKLDWCQVPFHEFKHMTPLQVSQTLALRMREALRATRRAIVLDVNVAAEMQPWGWATGVAELWRTGRDSHDRWASLMWNFTHNVQLYPSAGPGHWNDPDMLEIGNGGMSYDEYRTQFSLWSVMAAPLIAGNDLTRMTPQTQAILANRDVIAVDQDPLGVQGRAVASADGHWVLVKPLANGRTAVVIFNETAELALISTSIEQIGQAAGRPYVLHDLWTGEVGHTTGEINVMVAPHAVVMYVVAGA